MYAVHDSATGENSLLEQLEAIALLPIAGPAALVINELVIAVVEGGGGGAVDETDGEAKEDDCTVDILGIVEEGSDELMELVDGGVDDVRLTLEVFDNVDDDSDGEVELVSIVGGSDDDTLAVFDVIRDVVLLVDIEDTVDDAALAVIADSEEGFEDFEALDSAEDLRDEVEDADLAAEIDELDEWKDVENDDDVDDGRELLESMVEIKVGEEEDDEVALDTVAKTELIPLGVLN